jgi:hypothetical protein
MPKESGSGASKSNVSTVDKNGGLKSERVKQRREEAREKRIAERRAQRKSERVADRQRQQSTQAK